MKVYRFEVSSKTDLESVLRAAARSIVGLRRSTHITHTLLPVFSCISFITDSVSSQPENTFRQSYPDIVM